MIVIRTSLTPIEDNLKGILYIAETETRVGVEGTDEYFETDVSGYYLIHKNDLAAMIDYLQKD